jgi:hypothetical protein
MTSFSLLASSFDFSAEMYSDFAEPLLPHHFQLRLNVSSLRGRWPTCNLILLCGLFIASPVLIDGPCFTLHVTSDPLQLRVRKPHLAQAINNRALLW